LCEFVVKFSSNCEWAVIVLELLIVRNCREMEQQQKSELSQLRENIAALQLERDQLEAAVTQKVIKFAVIKPDCTMFTVSA